MNRLTPSKQTQVIAALVHKVAADAFVQKAQDNRWEWETCQVPEREYFDLMGGPANLGFPYGNIVLTSTSRMLIYSRTVTPWKG